MSTIFEKIINREIPAEILFEDTVCIAIRDVAPQAPTHALVIPKKPIPRIEEAKEDDLETLGRLLLVAGEVARSEKLDKGFRVNQQRGPRGRNRAPSSRSRYRRKADELASG